MKPKQEIPDFEFIERIAKTLDTRYTLPGTRFRFGLDPILGLIPWVGDAVTFVVQGTLAAYMLRHGASGKVAIKMFLNVIIDTLLGSIPIVGQIGDFFYKANIKNIRLLKEHYREGKHQGSGKGIIVAIVFFMLVFIILLGYLMYKIFSWVYHLIWDKWS